MQPVVLDSNIFVAAGFKPKSASGEILQAVREARLVMIWNEATREETERILGKIPPLRYLQLGPVFRAEARFDGETTPERFREVPDPDDRKFAALAHAAGAVLISNDEDLLGCRDCPGLEVLRPGVFRERLRELEEEEPQS